MILSRVLIRIETYFVREGLKKCEYKHTLFIKLKEGGKLLVVSLYVDDLIWKLCDYVWWFQNLYCKPLLAQGLFG